MNFEKEGLTCFFVPTGKTGSLAVDSTVTLLLLSLDIYTDKDACNKSGRILWGMLKIYWKWRKWTGVKIREAGWGKEKNSRYNLQLWITNDLLENIKPHRLLVYERSNFALKAVGSYPPEWPVFYWECQSVCALQPWTTLLILIGLSVKESKCRACSQPFNSLLICRSKA